MGISQYLHDVLYRAISRSILNPSLKNWKVENLPHRLFLHDQTRSQTEKKEQLYEAFIKFVRQTEVLKST